MKPDFSEFNSTNTSYNYLPNIEQQVTYDLCKDISKFLYQVEYANFTCKHDIYRRCKYYLVLFIDGIIGLINIYRGCEKCNDPYCYIDCSSDIESIYRYCLDMSTIKLFPCIKDISRQLT